MTSIDEALMDMYKENRFLVHDKRTNKLYKAKLNENPPKKEKSIQKYEINADTRWDGMDKEDFRITPGNYFSYNCMSGKVEGYNKFIEALESGTLDEATMTHLQQPLSFLVLNKEDTFTTSNPLESVTNYQLYFDYATIR